MQRRMCIKEIRWPSRCISITIPNFKCLFTNGNKGCVTFEIRVIPKSTVDVSYHALAMLCPISFDARERHFTESRRHNRESLPVYELWSCLMASAVSVSHHQQFRRYGLTACRWASINCYSHPALPTFSSIRRRRFSHVLSILWTNQQIHVKHTLIGPSSSFSSTMPFFF